MRRRNFTVDYVGLLCTGKSDFDAIETKREDAFFKCALGIGKVPSSLRQRFDDHDTTVKAQPRPHPYVDGRECPVSP